MTAFLDTHEVVKELKVAGFTDEQAEAVTRAMHRGQGMDLSNLATKSDLKALRLSIESDLRVGRAKTRAEILKWMIVGIIGLHTVVILGAVVALAR